MRFPRNARIFRGQLDAAPFATVSFLLVIFVMLGTLVYVPGVRVDLPSSDGLVLPGTERPTISVAVTTNAIFFDNQSVSEDYFSNQLSIATRNSPQALTLVVQADKEVTWGKLFRLAAVAHQAGVSEMQYATLPRVFDAQDAH